MARSAEEVIPALQAVEEAVEQGRHAAGFVSYEAASGLNPDLAVMEPASLPLVWFGIFAERHSYTPDLDDSNRSDFSISPLETNIEKVAYNTAINNIRDAIATGETYQVNFTTRQRFSVEGDPFALYRRMCRNQRAPFCAWIDTGEHRIISASPELFFALEGDCLTMSPMKGTASRLPLAAKDREQREKLAASAKERAENLMIVDLVRNDLSTIAETGSVEVPSLFDIETYQTVHQMTSTVTAKIQRDNGLSEIFRALFPCGSVTGAPKRRTMEIIRRLEDTPRGVYCGAIGYFSPGREALFSVAIRTAIVETATGSGEIGIGSGITWDSVAESEYRECLAKSAFLTREPCEFSLIESLRHDFGGFSLLERHLQRLAASAAYFGFRLDADDLRTRLAKLAEGLCGIHKVRVLLTVDGMLTLESEPLTEPAAPAPPSLLAVSKQRVDSSDTFLYHKTTRRELYDREREHHPGCVDIIFLNERDELTEGSYNNIVIAMRGELLTPAIGSGLLPGVLREELIEAGAIREAVLTLNDLHTADTIWLINSVRGWRECKL
jgi:para-aminobenzoate synthetase / 4-amino-4-deoxychorismate lyase